MRADHEALTRLCAALGVPVPDNAVSLSITSSTQEVTVITYEVAVLPTEAVEVEFERHAFEVRPIEEADPLPAACPACMWPNPSLDHLDRCRA